MGSMAKRPRAGGRFVKAPKPVEPVHPRFKRYVLFPEDQQRLLQEVRKRPGSTMRELRQVTGLHHAKVTGHLKRLEEAGLVAVQRWQGADRIFPAEAAGNLRADLELRQPAQRRLLLLIESKPDLRQDEILALAAGWGWPKSTTQHRLKRLEKVGVIRRETTGDRRYRPGHSS